jgi:hypothetical protein
MLEISMIIGGILLRLVPHLPNFSSISATALFGGAFLKKRYALILPLLAVAVSDYLLLYINPFGNPVLDFSRVHTISAMLHTTTPFVWGSFVVSGLIGLWLRKNLQPSKIVIATLLASMQFYFITNFGVWAGGAYSRGLDGLFTSYLMGLPFLRWTLLGDLFYTSVFFGSFALAQRLKFSQSSTENLAQVIKKPAKSKLAV